MRLFYLLVQSSWPVGLCAVTLSAISGMATLGLITVIHKTLSDPNSDTAGLAVLFALACLTALLTQVMSKCLLVKLSQSTAARLRFELSTRIMTAPLQQLEEVGASKLYATLIGDVNSITSALTSLPGLCAKVMVLLCGLVYLACLSIPLALGTIVVAAIGVATYLAGIRWANVYLRQAREDQDDVIKQMRAMVAGIKELKGNNERRLEFFYDVLLPADSKMRKNVITGRSIQGFAHSWGRLFLFVGMGLLLFVWPRLATVNAATLTGYTLTILYLTFPLNGILAWLPSMNSALISLNKINSLGLLIESTDEGVVTTVHPQFESLRIKNVSFKYPTIAGEGFALGPIDLTVEPQEVLFVAGGNGSGKTTFAKLLTGMYRPHEGHLEFNGDVVDDTNRGDFRQLFSTIYVEGHLFDRLLAVEANPMQIRYWLNVLGIEGMVDLSTGRLAENDLSRGQKKRLALLVACLDERPIFVFDEWAAEQDPTFKDTFYLKILPELRRQGRTVIAITHDDRYFDSADRVVKLTDGRLQWLSQTSRKAA